MDALEYPQYAVQVLDIIQHIQVSDDGQPFVALETAFGHLKIVGTKQQVRRGIQTSRVDEVHLRGLASDRQILPFLRIGI